MADKFNLNDEPAGGAGNEGSGAAGVGPGSTSGAGTGEGGNSGAKSGDSGGEGIAPNLTATGTVRKRRPGGGRKPFPRDENGNIIRDAGAATNKSGKEGLAVKNDRAKVKTNIAGLHAMAAVLTRQPILNLNDKEADALTNSLCDVADYHGFNLITAGGAFGLYASLATCTYMIYVPRIVAIKNGNQSISGNSNAPPKPSEARERAMGGMNKMDFSGDGLQ